jgi:preprotein translocase subunit SecB
MDNASTLLKIESVDLSRCYFDKFALIQVIKQELNEDIDIEIAYNRFNNEDFKNKFAVHVNVVVSYPMEETRTPMTSCMMSGFFEMIGEPAPEADLARWAHVNCAAIIFPFLREHLSSMYVKANLGPYLLSPINFEHYYQKLLEKSGTPLPSDSFGQP